MACASLRKEVLSPERRCSGGSRSSSGGMTSRETSRSCSSQSRRSTTQSVERGGSIELEETASRWRSVSPSGLDRVSSSCSLLRMSWITSCGSSKNSHGTTLPHTGSVSMKFGRSLQQRRSPGEGGQECRRKRGDFQ